MPGAGPKNVTVVALLWREHMPELVCELIVSLDGFARGQRSPGYFGYFGPDFAEWIKTNTAIPHRMLVGHPRSLVAPLRESDYLELQGLDGPGRPRVWSVVLPSRHMTEFSIVAQRVAFFGLVFRPEMCAARLIAL